MAKRKPVMTVAKERPELDRLVAEALSREVSDEELCEQRISFVFGNAPFDSGVTRESARAATRSMRLKKAAS